MTELAQAVGTLLADNKTPFFPAFTDHGPEHVEQVLDAAIRLIPDEVWSQGLLGSCDAAVLTSACLIHDLAMHIRVAGFVELVEPRTRFVPRPWFSEPIAGRAADQPWAELWRQFQHEARHFGTSQLDLLLGPPHSGIPQVAYDEDLEPEKWVEADFLLIGEFIRRHHARLAHEIAFYGFPGLDESSFPVLGSRLPDLADPIGAVARSHGEPVRRMLDYLEWLDPGSKRPAGALLMFHMALLRVADYLQIEARRAPPLLLGLKQPQSPLSIEEWNKHGAISAVSWQHRDPLAISVTVSPSHKLRTHLALRDLFQNMQMELDTATAVLSEVYGLGELSSLELARRRVTTNLDEPGLHAQLPFVPTRAALRSDPDLFRLVIRDLYGNRPSIAGRELIQNAVDAVRELRRWEKRTGKEVPAGELRDLDTDVQVSIDELQSDQCVFEVADLGIGMTPELVVDYYLQAGASFGPAMSELEDLDTADAIATMRAGRFGVGAFAAFLLGPELHVTTRHVESQRGLSFRARIDSDLVEIRWVEDAPIGTSVSIVFDPTSLRTQFSFIGFRESPTHLLEAMAKYYRLSFPRISFLYRSRGDVQTFPPPADVPSPGRSLPNHWRAVRNTDVDAVLWQVPVSASRWAGYDDDEPIYWLPAAQGEVVHNGISIEDPGSSRLEQDTYEWSSGTMQDVLQKPRVAVFDSKHLLGLALTRFALTEPTLPFEPQLLESIGLDIAAHALVTRPTDCHPLLINSSFPAYTCAGWFPPLPDLLRRYSRGMLLVAWRPGAHARRTRGKSVDPIRFLGSRSPLFWREFAQRTVLSLENTDPGRDDFTEVERWGHSLEGISESTRHRGAALGARALATVVIRGQIAPVGDGEKAIATDAEEHYWEAVGHGFVQSPGDEHDEGIFLGPVPNRDPALEARLIKAALTMRDTGEQWIALTAYGDFQRLDASQECLATPWEKVIGGPLPRAPGSARRLAATIAGKRAEIRRLMDKWEQSLKDAGD